VEELNRAILPGGWGAIYSGLAFYRSTILITSHSKRATSETSRTWLKIHVIEDERGLGRGMNAVHNVVCRLCLAHSSRTLSSIFAHRKICGLRSCIVQSPSYLIFSWFPCPSHFHIPPSPIRVHVPEEKNNSISRHGFSTRWPSCLIIGIGEQSELRRLIMDAEDN
jgi:hypothetical protein